MAMDKSEWSYELQVYLQEDIILKILASQPAKSVGRCRCLSKQWRSQLSDPRFIKTHLDVSLNNRPRKALVYHQESVFVVDFHDSVASARELNKPEMPYDWMPYPFSYNGLILTRAAGPSKLELQNPTTLESKEFPEPPGGALDFVFPLVGIGYNKVVAINNDKHVSVCTFGGGSVATWKWLPIQKKLAPLNGFRRWGNRCKGAFSNGVFCNGAIHWLGLPPGCSPTSFIILAFDLIKETFRVVPTRIPPTRVEEGIRSTLGMVGGSLCVVCEEEMYENQQVVDVWVMNEYGVESSWTMRQFPHHRQQIGFFSESPLFLGNDELMLISSHSKAVIHNLKKEYNNSSSRIIDISQLPFTLEEDEIHSCTFFVDSLVSPSQFLQ